jgi:hypothetical protein
MFYRSLTSREFVMYQSHDKKKHDESNQITILRLLEYIEKMKGKKDILNDESNFASKNET